MSNRTLPKVKQSAGNGGAWCGKLVVASLEARMAAFDNLPAEVRAELNQSSFKWDTTGLARAIARGMSPQQAIDAIRKTESENFDAPIIGAIWGPGHPQARGLTAQALGL